jgi:hydroxymethylglutaryl-CoA synthase
MPDTYSFTNVNLASFGVYVPPFRLAVAETARVWQTDGRQLSQSLGITHKAIADVDEDSITMAVAAGKQALDRASVPVSSIGAVYMGSESHPYAVKASGSIVADWLGLPSTYFCADLQFACKAATSGIQIVAAMIESGMIEAGLVLASDKAQAKPGDVLEYSTASSAVALLLTKKPGIAKLVATKSYASDTPDFWRRQGQEAPTHLGRFSGQPAYFTHVAAAIELLSQHTKSTVTDYDHVVLHMPNKKFPQAMAKKFGITKEQMQYGFTQPYIGNPYTASTLLGLSRVLSFGQKNESVLQVAYGSGAGADALSWRITKSGNKQYQTSITKQLEANC